MAFTAFHCALVWPLFILRPKRFDFIGLSVGAVIPDVLIPATFVVPEFEHGIRILTHSLIGAITFDFLVGLIVAVLVVPRVVQFFKRTSCDPRGHRFAGVEVLQRERRTRVVAYSLLIGTTSHVLLDVLYHGGSPAFYPLPWIIFPLEEVLLWELLSHGAILIVFLYLAYVYWWKMGTAESARAAHSDTPKGL